jgi:glutathione S-transferase
VVNPKGRVPSIATDRGILTETPAILAFIAQHFPEAALAPLADPFAFAQVQAFNRYLCSTVHAAHAHDNARGDLDTIHAAITAHGGEATLSESQFEALSNFDQMAIVTF